MIDKLIIKCRIMIFLFTLLIAGLITGTSLGQENPVKIGVLAIRGADQCLEKWSPTAQYLSARIPDRTFVIIPLDHKQIYPSVERGEVDFILANPSFYVELEYRYGANRIATLKNLCLDSFYTRYWGVIFWRADRSDIQQINDLKGKTFMATAEGSLGGWRMVWRELKEMGIDPYRDFKDLKFIGTQDAVVYAVRDGKVDAGSVRADTFIRMHAEGKIDLEDFYVPHEHGEKSVDCPPFPHSTRGYPEWPMAKIKDTPDELAEKVAIALIEMPSDSPAAIAAKCGGWTIPMNYQPVHECLRYLKVGPYKDLGKITIADVIRTYWPWILFTIVLFLVITGFSITILILNRNIKASHIKLENVKAYTRGLIESSPDALVTFDEKGIITDVNEQMAKLTKYAREELIGSQFRDYFTDPERADLGVKKSFEEGKVTNYGLVMKSKRDNDTIVSYNATVYRDEKGQVRGVFAAARDISETKRMVKELEDTKAYTRGLIESSLDALVTFDEKGIITDVNEQTIKLTEYTREELIGSQFRNYFTDPERADLGVKKSFEEEKVTNYELVMKSKRDNETIVSYNATVYRDEKGQVRGVFAAARDISETKRMVKELEDAKAYTRGLIESSLDALVTFDEKGIITDVNEQTIKLTEYTREELIGSQFRNYFTDPERADLGVKKSFEEEKVTNYELVMKSKKDNETIVSYNATVYRDEKGQVRGVFAAARDISETKRMVKELEDAKAYTRGLIESSLDALVTFDEKGIITDVNEQTIKLTEYTREELIGSQFRNYFTDPERADLGVKKSFEEEKVTNYELVMKSKRDNETIVSYNATVYRDEKGQVRGVFAAARDISETKRMVKELEDTKAYTRGLIESSLDALVTFDEKGIITDVNEQTIKLTKCAREELIGSQFRDYFTDPERADLGVKRSFEEEKVTDYELVMKSKRDNETIVSYNATVYRDEKGQARGVFAAARDISESKRVEKELIKAKEAAETATIAKSEFLANMSHEIRTPMNGVIAAAELALSEKMSPRTEHYLKIIQSSAYSLLGIINDILDFSKIEADKLDLEKHPFLLDEVIDRITDAFMTEAAGKRIELLVDIDLEAPNALIGDPLRLQQILKNLVSNAVKFTEIGGIILVRVKESEKSADCTTLTFSIKDTGIGIAPKYLSKLFKPFSQVDTSSTREYEGTGLGLSICKRLVEMMGGRIWAESELGKGSTFSFTICLGRQSADQKQKLVPPPDIQHLNVLVVDDCADSRLIMQKMLESFGLRVKLVSSGEESLKALEENKTREEPFELVVIDWLMPGLGGIETSKRIRKDLKLTIPIIMMTAFGKENEMLDAEKAGINAFLTKPIHQSTLFNAIMDTFGKKALKIEEKEKHITTKASIYKNFLRGIRILVAEDNPTNQEIALAILEGAGIVVEIADNGKKVVEALQRSRFDAVLMDIQMPEMDGYEATRMIRKDSKFKSLPIIAMTAHAMKGDEEKCLQAGMDGYVSKPISQDRLFHTIWKSMKHQKKALYSGEPETSEAIDITVTQTEDLPKRLPGINIQDALSALNIDKAVFKHILIGFLKNNKKSANKIREAFKRKDWELIMQLAHSLKGSAGNIGADKLYKAAQELETAGREGAPTSALLDKVETALNQVLESLQMLADTSKTEPLPGKEHGTGPGVDPAQVIPVLKQLADALDLAEPEEIKKHMEIIKKYLDISIFRNLEDQVNDYEYDKALKTLKGIMEEMEKKSAGQRH